MIRTRGLDKDFDRLIETDASARYVVDHPELLRSAHVPRRYLGKNPDGSIRNQREFRVFASVVRYWGKWIADEAEKKLIRQEVSKTLRMHLIKINDAKRQAVKVLSDVKTEFIRHQNNLKKKQFPWWAGQVPVAELPRELVHV